MRTVLFAVLAACGGVLASPATFGNEAAPPKIASGSTPAEPSTTPKTNADTTTVIAGAAAAVGAAAIGVWFLRRSTRPGP
jgi:hypothetical protein